MAESNERKYPNVKYSWKTTLGKSHCLIFTNHANSFAILSGCSVVGVNFFLLLFHIHVCYILILSKHAGLAIWKKQNRIVGDIFLKLAVSLICKGAGVLKAAVSLSQQWEVSYLIWLYTPASSPGCPPCSEECRTCVTGLSCLPVPTPSSGSLQLNSRNRQKFQDMKFCKKWIQFI